MGNCVVSQKEFSKHQQELAEYKKAEHIRFGVQQKRIEESFNSLIDKLSEISQNQQKGIKTINDKLELFNVQSIEEKEPPHYIS